jgi:hypothetical protein
MRRRWRHFLTYVIRLLCSMALAYVSSMIIDDPCHAESRDLGSISRISSRHNHWTDRNSLLIILTWLIAAWFLWSRRDCDNSFGWSAHLIGIDTFSNYVDVLRNVCPIECSTVGVIPRSPNPAAFECNMIEFDFFRGPPIPSNLLMKGRIVTVIWVAREWRTSRVVNESDLSYLGCSEERCRGTGAESLVIGNQKVRFDLSPRFDSWQIFLICFDS